MYITLKKGIADVSVDLNLDLDLYCQLAKPLYCGSIHPDQVLPVEIADELRLRVSLSPFPSYKSAFQSVRQILEEELSDLGGGIEWVKIEQLLRSQCEEITKLVSPAAVCQVLVGQTVELARSIQAVEAECFLNKQREAFAQLKQYANLHKLHHVLGLKNKPLAIEAMQCYFIELLKNSIDAIVENYFLGKHETTELKMNIAIRVISDGRIVVTVSDNAGGFSEEYMTHFSERSLGEKKLWDSGKHKDKKYFFGGHGLGLSQLYDLVSAASGKGSSVDKVISLGNNDAGAEVTITTSLEPYAPSSESQQRKRRVSSDSEQGEGAQQHRFMPPPRSPCHKRPRVRTVEPPATSNNEINVARK